MLKALNKNLEIGTLREQWELLIIQPLALLKPELPQQSLLLVIDALDECEGDRDVWLILRLLASANTHIPTIQFRVLVTSRPDTPIHLGFRETPGIWHRDLVLNKVPREAVDHDIAIYFSEELKDICRHLNRQIIGRLVDKASGLFIWAASACRFIKNGKHYAIHAQKRLTLLLEGGTDQTNPEKELDQIYTKILSESIGETQERDEKYEADEDEYIFEIFRRVVGSIVILFAPLSINALSSLIGTSASKIQQTDIEEILSHLLSILEVPANSAAPIRLLHPSFRDFLLSEKRCQKTQLQVNEKNAHRTLANDCIRVMSTSLRRDICGLQHPGSLFSEVTRSQVEQCIRPEIQYACLYWVEHLHKSDMPLRDADEVYPFLRLHLLHWLETLAWLGRTSEAIMGLISLEDRIEADRAPRLHELVRDAKRFAVYNRRIIEEAPLQLYCSALLFAPENSVIRRQFRQDIPGWILTKPKIEQHWNAALYTLEGHNGDVTSVAFSPDSKWVASGSKDGTVRLWEAATGTALQKFEGHSASVTSVAISPDGKSVVSGSWDKTVRLWDAATGSPLQTLETCSHYVSSIAYSPDGKLVASRTHDKTVRLWDAATGATLQTLKGHSGYVTSVAFSPDGRSVVSGSGDRTVRLWEAATGAALQTFEGHSAYVTSAAFSSDGMTIVSGSADGSVRLWEAATGAALQTLEGHSKVVTSVAISPDGGSVVTASWDAMRLWDATTGGALRTLEHHDHNVTSVAFSPDAKLVVSRCTNGSIGRWDAGTGAKLDHHYDWASGTASYDWASVAFSLNGEVIMTLLLVGTVSAWDPASDYDRCNDDSGYVGCVAFSPDGRSVLSGSDDGTVRLWDAGTGTALQNLEGHSEEVTSVAFSLCGRSIVSGSADGTVQLWNATTGTALRQLNGHSEVVTSVAFSPDGKSVVSGSDDGTLRLWDAATGAALQKLEGHSGKVSCVAFSPDARSIVSGSADGFYGLADATVRLWDVASDTVLQPLEGHSDYVRSVAFSPDGRLVVSGSDDGTVRLWDATTGTALRKFKGHSGEVISVAFCADGRSIVSASDDDTVQLWDALTGAVLWKKHRSWVCSVAFTPDGKVVVCGSHGGEVRLWDVATGTGIDILVGQQRNSDSIPLALSLDGRSIASRSYGVEDELFGMISKIWAGDSIEVLSLMMCGMVDKSVVLGRVNGTVRLWDATTGAALHKLKGHYGEVSCVAFSLDSRLVVSGSEDQTVRLWDTTTGAALQTLEGHSEVVTSVAFSPDSKSVVSGSNDGEVRLWDAATGDALQNLEGHSGKVVSVVFSPDGELVLSGSRDCTARLWNAVTGAALQTLSCDSEYLTSVAFSSDGRLVVCKSEYQQLRLWDATTGALLVMSNGNWGKITSATIPSGGKVVDTLLLSGHWIKHGEENIIWLPPNHRGDLMGTHMGAIVLAQSSGRIILMRFRSGPKVV